MGLADEFQESGWLDDLDAESVGAVKVADASADHLPDTGLDGELENRFIIGIAQDGNPARAELPLFGNDTKAIQRGIDLFKRHSQITRMALEGKVGEFSHRR